MKLKELIKIIESKYPLYLKEKWDNIGLMIGDLDKEVTKILVTLDASSNAIDEAIENEFFLRFSKSTIWETFLI